MPYKNRRMRLEYDRERDRKWSMPKAQRTRRRYLTAYERRAIKHLRLEEEVSMAEIARRTGLSYGTIFDVVHDRSKLYKPVGAASPRIPTAEEQVRDA